LSRDLHNRENKTMSIFVTESGSVYTSCEAPDAIDEIYERHEKPIVLGCDKGKAMAFVVSKSREGLIDKLFEDGDVLVRFQLRHGEMVCCIGTEAWGFTPAKVHATKGKRLLLVGKTRALRYTSRIKTVIT
jgi:hypothetical protein